MYIPRIYKNENLEEVREFIRANPFGIVVNQIDGRPWATHLPLELESRQDGKFVLVGHLSKANLQGKSFIKTQGVLCIFNGPHTYVSSSWYREEEVPTWDYIAVHVYGQLRVLDDEELYLALDRLMKRYEQPSEKPVSLSGLSEKTLRQIRGVIGFEILVEEVQAAYKLSQGRPEDHERIISELASQDDPGAKAVSEAIKKVAGNHSDKMKPGQ